VRLEGQRLLQEYQIDINLEISVYIITVYIIGTVASHYKVDFRRRLRDFIIMNDSFTQVSM